MKKLFLILALGILSFANAQSWKTVTNEKEIKPVGERVIIPKKYKVFHLGDNSFKNALWASPDEAQVNLANSSAIIELPMPDGTLKKFRVVQSPVMAPELAAQFPNIKTFNVVGVDEPGVSGKLDWTEMGFHAMLRRVSGDIFIDPFSRNNYTDYISYYKYDFEKDPKYITAESGDVIKPTTTPTKKKEAGAVKKTEAVTCVGATLRKYRLAVACTHEYAIAATGQASPTVAQTLSAIVTTVNRVDGVYETELAIKMVLVATETLVVYTNAGTDPFTGNNNANTLITESQTIIDNNISDANYDVGHTFSTGGGGLSTLGGVCTTGQKASSITGSPQPVGDGYDIDYVAHEMGHDFGGDHTFRAVTGSCSGNENPGTMVEPGSGITIMAYAGICSPNDDSTHSIPYFHAISYDEIVAYTNTGAGNGCPVQTASNNHPPVVTSSANYVVPVSTPFSLTGSATDADGDVLTYSWEEVDDNSTGGNWNDGQKPYFRSNNPVGSPTRMFPKLSMVLAGGSYTTTIGEFLPTTAQTLNFRLTARDNKMGGGGVCSAVSTVTINATAGPFSISYPSAAAITWASGSSQTVTWNVNGTSAAPISCANVNILISYNSGQTFSTLMNNVPNNGSKLITVPTLSTTISTCRIRVESAGNVFFDISKNNFTITAGATTGIAGNATSNMAMQLAPNPANDELTVLLYGLKNNEKSSLRIYDLLGNILVKDEIQGKENVTLQYNISSLASGMYMVEVSGGSTKAVSRLIKQ
jgi:hypothetical protein